jgi:hypothetical protein
MLLEGFPRSIQDVLEDGCPWDSDIVEPPEEGLKKQDLQLFGDALLVGFPDLVLTLDKDSLCINGRRIAFEFSFTGTNTGWFRNVGVTNRKVTLKGVGFAQFGDDGLIGRLTTNWNCTRAMAQLGVRAHMRPDPVPLSSRTSSSA